MTSTAATGGADFEINVRWGLIARTRIRALKLSRVTIGKVAVDRVAQILLWHIGKIVRLCHSDCFKNQRCLHGQVNGSYTHLNDKGRLEPR